MEVQREYGFDEGIRVNHPELKTHPIVQHSPLNIRDVLHGGRKEATRLHYKIREGKTIQHVDVMSLYPFVCKYFKYPIGHPVIHVGDACQDTKAMLQKDGLIKCSILQPKRLYHPVLPYRCKIRLMFCLCRTCTTEQNRTADSTHDSVAERTLVGTWVMDEVRLAVEKGYQIVVVYEVYEYDVTQYDQTTGTGRFFAEYICTFLKLNAEASGYSDWVQYPDDEERYICDLTLPKAFG